MVFPRLVPRTLCPVSSVLLTNEIYLQIERVGFSSWDLDIFFFIKHELIFFYTLTHRLVKCRLFKRLFLIYIYFKFKFIQPSFCYILYIRLLPIYINDRLSKCT